MLKPNNAWKWFYDKKGKSLMLDLGQDMVFSVGFAEKELIPDAFKASTFTVEDATLFQTFWSGVEALNLSGPRKTELVLNAVAAARFHKPILPKSWFFQRNQRAFAIEVGTLVQLKTDHSCEPFLVVENTGHASFCLLAGEGECWLNETKRMSFSQGIKVMNDCMSLYRFISSQDPNSNFALVG